MALDGELQLNQSLTLIERHALLEEIYYQLARFPIPPSIELNDLQDEVLSTPEFSMYDPAPLLPRFTGAHPNKWIAYAERYFTYYRIHNTERFPYVLNLFYDEAAMWLTFYQFTEWSDFIESLVQRFGYSRNALQVFDEMPNSIETKTISAIHETIDDKVMEIQTDSIVDVHESLGVTDAQMDILDYNFVLARVTPGLNLVLAIDSKKNDMGIITCDIDSYVDSVVIHSFAWKPGLTVNRVQVHDSFRDIDTEFFTIAIGRQFYGSQARSLQPNIHLNVVFKNLIIVGNNLWNKQIMQRQKHGRMVLFISPSTFAIPVTPRHIIARNALEENADTKLGYDSSPHIGPAWLPLFVLGAVLPCHDFHLNMLGARYRLMEVNRHLVPVLFDSTIVYVADYLMPHAADLVKTSTTLVSTTLSPISNLDSLLEFPATPISLTLKRGNPELNRSDADNFKPNPCVSTDPIQVSSTTIIVTAVCTNPGHITIVNGKFINFLVSYGSTFWANWLWKNFHFDPGPTFVHTSYSNRITGTYAPNATDSLQSRGSFLRGKQANLNMGRNDTGIIEINTSNLTHMIAVVITNMSKEAIGSLTAEPIDISLNKKKSALSKIWSGSKIDTSRVLLAVQDFLWLQRIHLHNWFKCNI